MYAVTETSYRAISSADELQPGERVENVIPPSLLNAQEVDEARRRRNSMLRDSDWTQVPDSPLEALERSAWTVYRQALRDLPDVPGFPDCQWPTPPDLGQDDADESGGHL